MHRKGFATLTSLIIISGLLLSAGLAIHIQLRAHYQDMSIDAQRVQTHELALSCLEEGRYQASQHPLYTTGTLSFSGGSCTINVTKLENSYIITTEARIKDVIKRFRMESKTIDGIITPTHIEELP
ncbi:MAG: hypothetical protein WC495_01685 [Patescibacteria group bacterium]|jgi:hypothetical protein